MCSRHSPWRRTACVCIVVACIDLNALKVRDCGLALDLPQLNLISCGPKSIDFGQIFVKSGITKSFSVFNDLPQCVLVSLGLDGIDLLQRSTPTSQVIPSDSDLPLSAQLLWQLSGRPRQPPHSDRLLDIVVDQEPPEHAHHTSICTSAFSGCACDAV